MQNLALDANFLDRHAFPELEAGAEGPGYRIEKTTARRVCRACLRLDGSNLTAVTNDTLYDGFQTFNVFRLNP